MHWLDVAGAPGSGKSTACDALWGPHELPIENRLPPSGWHDFLNEVSRLFWLIQKHPSFQAAIRMNNRSIRKIATVARAYDEKGPYVQTALVQRGLGFGWRLNDLGIDLGELRHFYRLMPVSIGVAVTRCPESVVVERNHQRETVRATAHENRDFMVPLMLPAIEIALETLSERGVPILELDTTLPVEETRKQLIEFAGKEPFDAAQGRSCGQVSVLSPPPWWQ